MNKKKLTGKEAVFKRYWNGHSHMQMHIKSNTPKNMGNLRIIEIRNSTLVNVMKDMGWTEECTEWGEVNGILEKLKKCDEEFRERFGTKEEPKEHYRYCDTHLFEKVAMDYYHEAIANQGISHGEFMRRFRSEFSDVLENIKKHNPKGEMEMETENKLHKHEVITKFKLGERVTCEGGRGIIIAIITRHSFFEDGMEVFYKILTKDSRTFEIKEEGLRAI